MPTAPDFSSETQQSPTWYVYDQFSFDPLVEFQFPSTTLATGELRRAGNKEVHYRRVFGHPYSMETFSGETPQSSSQPVQLGRYQYFYFNQRNDVTSLLKHNGQSLHSYLYDEYGMLYDNNKKPTDASNFTDPHNHYTFSAKEFDEESELSYFGARYYDSWSGTWATQDRYRGDYFDPQTLHRYAFVANNPINLIDRYGFKHEEFKAQYGRGDYYGSAEAYIAEAARLRGAHIKLAPPTQQQISIKIGQPIQQNITIAPPQESPQIKIGKPDPRAKIYLEIPEKGITLIFVTPRAENQFCKLKVKERNQVRCLVYEREEKASEEAQEIPTTEIEPSFAERFAENVKRYPQFLGEFAKETLQEAGKGASIILEVAPGTGDISDVYAAHTGKSLFEQEKVNPTDVGAYAMLPFLTSGQTRKGVKALEKTEEIVLKVKGRVGKLFEKESIQITEKTLEKHIIPRHILTTQFLKKSKFLGNVDFVDLVKKAENIEPTLQKQTGNFERIVDAGKIIGIDKTTGKSTTIYTVITDVTGHLVTIFPGVPTNLTK